jgi:hypothetical protein
MVALIRPGASGKRSVAEPDNVSSPQERAVDGRRRHGSEAIRFASPTRPALWLGQVADNATRYTRQGPRGL